MIFSERMKLALYGQAAYNVSAVTRYYRGMIKGAASRLLTALLTIEIFPLGMISMRKHLVKKVSVCLMYPHRHAVGAVLLTIFASKGEQMYRYLALPFRLQ